MESTITEGICNIKIYQNIFSREILFSLVNIIKTKITVYVIFDIFL